LGGCIPSCVAEELGRTCEFSGMMLDYDRGSLQWMAHSGNRIKCRLDSREYSDPNPSGKCLPVQPPQQAKEPTAGPGGFVEKFRRHSDADTEEAMNNGFPFCPQCAFFILLRIVSIPKGETTQPTQG